MTTPTTTHSLVLPTLPLGSGARELRKQAKESYQALGLALDVLRRGRPNGRDYCSEKLVEARETYEDLITRVESVRAELTEFAKGVR